MEELQLININGVREIENHSFYHSQNCCRQYLPMDAKMSRWNSELNQNICIVSNNFLKICSNYNDKNSKIILN